MTKNLMLELLDDNLKILRTTINLIHLHNLQNEQEYLDFLDEVNKMSVTD